MPGDCQGAKKRREQEGKTPILVQTERTKWSAFRVQIYNKSREIKVSGKDWMTELWRAKEAYTEGLPVFRAEFSFFRKALRQLKAQDLETGKLRGIDTIADLRSSQGDLIRYIVGGDGKRSWFRVASPATRDRDTELRGPAPWWEELSRAFLDDMPETGRIRSRSASSSLSLKTTQRIFQSWAVRFAAQARLHGLNPGDSPEEFLGPFARQGLPELLELKRLGSFEEAVSLKVNEIRANGEPPPP